MTASAREGPSRPPPVGNPGVGSPRAQGTTLSCWQLRWFQFPHQVPSIVWFAASARLWVRRTSILPTACSLQAPLRGRKHPPLERMQRGRRKYLCHHLRLVRTFHNPAWAFPSCQSPCTVLWASKLSPKPAVPTPPSTHLNMPFLPPAICPPAISQILTHPSKPKQGPPSPV